MDKSKINPKHYRRGIETIKVLESKLTSEQYEGFLLGNVIKYTTRYSMKNGIEDLHKAEWYLNRLIHHVAKQPSTSEAIKAIEGETK